MVCLQILCICSALATSAALQSLTGRLHSANRNRSTHDSYRFHPPFQPSIPETPASRKKYLGRDSPSFVLSLSGMFTISTSAASATQPLALEGLLSATMERAIEKLPSSSSSRTYLASHRFSQQRNRKRNSVLRLRLTRQVNAVARSCSICPIRECQSQSL